MALMPRDLFVEKERVQPLLVEAGLQLGDDDNQPILAQGEVLQHLLFGHLVDLAGFLLVLAVGVDDVDRRVGVLRVLLLLHQRLEMAGDGVFVGDGGGDGGDGQHGFTGAANLAVDILDQQIGDIRGDGVDAFAVLVDLLLGDVLEVFLREALELVGGQVEEQLGGDGHDVGQRVEDVAVLDGLLHGVGVEGHPEFFALGVAAELAKTRQRVVVGRGGKADEHVLLGAFAVVRGVGVEGRLQLVEDGDHLLVLVAAVRAVDFVDQKGDAQLGQLLQHVGGEHLAHAAELLQVDDDDARVGLERFQKGRLVVRLHKHLLVDVHVEHLAVDLAAQLEAVDDDHDLVVDIFAVAPQVFELQRRPADDVRLAKARRILEQQRVDMLVVAVGAPLFDQFLPFGGGNAGQLRLQQGEEVVVLVFVGQELVDLVEDLVRAELLLGAGRNQHAALVLQLLDAGDLGDLALDEVVVEDFLLDGSLGVVRGEDLLDLRRLLGGGVAQRIGLEVLDDLLLDHLAVEAPFAAEHQHLVERVGQVADDVGLAHIGGGEVDGALEDLEQIAPRLRPLGVAQPGVALEGFMVGAHGIEVILDHLAAPVLARALPHEVGLEFAVAQVDAVDKEAEVGAEGEDGLVVDLVRVGQFLHHAEDVLAEEVVAVDGAVAGVEEMQPHVAQRDRLVGVEKERHVAAAGAALLDHGDEVGQQLLAVAAVLAQQRGIVLFVERGARRQRPPGLPR